MSRRSSTVSATQQRMHLNSLASQGRGLTLSQRIVSVYDLGYIVAVDRSCVRRGPCKLNGTVPASYLYKKRNSCRSSREHRQSRPLNPSFSSSSTSPLRILNQTLASVRPKFTSRRAFRLNEESTHDKVPLRSANVHRIDDTDHLARRLIDARVRLPRESAQKRRLS
jgi:hypothetical protein